MKKILLSIVCMFAIFVTLCAIDNKLCDNGLQRVDKSIVKSGKMFEKDILAKVRNIGYGWRCVAD